MMIVLFLELDSYGFLALNTTRDCSFLSGTLHLIVKNPFR
jgi:hypothetical protein